MFEADSVDDTLYLSWVSVVHFNESVRRSPFMELLLAEVVPSSANRRTKEAARLLFCCKLIDSLDQRFSGLSLILSCKCTR